MTPRELYGKVFLVAALGAVILFALMLGTANAQNVGEYVARMSIVGDSGGWKSHTFPANSGSLVRVRLYDDHGTQLDIPPDTLGRETMVWCDDASACQFADVTGMPGLCGAQERCWRAQFGGPTSTVIHARIAGQWSVNRSLELKAVAPTATSAPVPPTPTIVVSGAPAEIVSKGVVSNFCSGGFAHGQNCSVERENSPECPTSFDGSGLLHHCKAMPRPGLRVGIRIGGKVPASASVFYVPPAGFGVFALNSSTGTTSQNAIATCGGGVADCERVVMPLEDGTLTGDLGVFFLIDRTTGADLASQTKPLPLRAPFGP